MCIGGRPAAARDRDSAEQQTALQVGSTSHCAWAGPLAAPAIPLQPHPLRQIQWETQIPASESGDAGGPKDKGMELLHRPPGLSLWPVSPLQLSAPALHFRCSYKRGRPWSSRGTETVLCLPAKSAEVPAQNAARRASPTRH